MCASSTLASLLLLSRVALPGTWWLRPDLSGPVQATIPYLNPCPKSMLPPLVYS